MKIKKTTVSIILFVTFVLTNIPTFATVNKIEEPIIREVKKDNRNIKSVQINDVPQITLDKQKSVPLNEKLSKNDSVTFSNKQAVTEIPHINFDASSAIIIPSKITEPSGEWTSSNEIDEEDIQETVSRNIDNNDNEEDSFQDNKADNINIRSGQGGSFDSLYRISNINSKDSFALQNQTGRTNYIGDNIGDEYVDPMTGNLIVTETDLSLPGVDGLDLNLSRYYSLAEAELYTKTAGLETDSINFEMPSGSYVVTESVYNTETHQTSTYQYPCANENEAITRRDEIRTRDNCDGLYIYNASYRSCTAGEIINVNYYITSNLTASSYSRVRSNLGAGWSWSFPSVQAIKDDYSDEYEIPKAMYFHDGKGNVMEVEYDHLNGCSFVNYVGKDIEFDLLGYYDSNICNSSRLDYMVEDTDCTRYYFGIYGEIRTIIDVYGNKITFNYSNRSYYGISGVPVLSSITDTVGRVISFSYTTSGDYEYITVTVSSPISTEGTLTLSYQKKMVDLIYQGQTLSSEPILESVTNSIGETTEYYPALIEGSRSYAQPVIFTFADKIFNSGYVYNTSGYANNLVYLLGNIVRPQSNTYYEYDLCERNLGHSGITQAYRISERGDNLLVTHNNQIVDGYSKNVVQYRYSMDYTGAGFYNSIETIPANTFVARTTEQRENAIIVRRFYKKHGAILEYERISSYTEPSGNDLTVTEQVQNYSYKIPSFIKLTYSNDLGYSYESYKHYTLNSSMNKSFGKPLLVTEEMDHDTAVGPARDKHGISYTYSPNTGFVLTKSWYKNTNSHCTESYQYNSDNRLIRTTLADNTQIQYSYITSNGKVTKKTTTTSNDEGTTVIEENYTSQTGYAYPSTIVKTVITDGVTASQTTSYTYNMLLGVVTSETDNSGNTTSYEYDNLGRITRIIHPRYTTYSSYNSKNVEILPIEDISYSTVNLEYDEVDGYNENLHAQEILNTVSYYDVTGEVLSNITDEILDDLTKLSYSLVINYYLGTGDLIQSSVLDKVEGNNSLNTTKYFYNTSAGTVTEVNPQGDSIITQYDGLGRIVKVTDEFGNWKITEHNISGDGVGFKSKSYFVSSADRTITENIVETTYDRLGRVTNEKTYLDYPDDYSEIQYFYDLAGNTVGIIDANGNLNEDGYTQKNTYDKLGRLLTTKNANNETITNTYDNLGNIKTQTIKDADNNQYVIYQRNYSGDGKIISDTDNSNNANTFSYDNMGRLVQRTDKNGKIYNAYYNQSGLVDRENHIVLQSTLKDIQYSYMNPYAPDIIYTASGNFDENENSYFVHLNEVCGYTYSPTGKMLSKTATFEFPTGADGVIFKPHIRYQYDSCGNIISAFYGCADDTHQDVLGITSFYTYDKNRISKVQVDGNNVRNSADSANARYEFYADGKLKSITFPTLTDMTVLKSEYTYDGIGRMETLTNYKGTDILSSYSYTYDANGNVTTIEETVGNDENTVNYTYDKLNRIATVSGTKGADSYYEYDFHGNRKANFEEIDFLSDENAEFSYDESDKMYYAEVGDDETYFDYASDGYRYVKQSNSAYPKFYIYDESGRLNGIARALNVTVDNETRTAMYPVKQYIWGPDRVLAQIDAVSNNIYYYLYNGHGDVVQIIDTAGNIVNSYDYDVWGNFLEKTETIENPFTYFGQTYDETTGLYYLRARYYDPTTGRFTQQDVAEDGYNWYVYGNNNPVRYVDPSGNSVTSSLSNIATNKYVHKAVWYIGAETYLKNKKFYTSAWMLEHSLLKSPSDAYRGDSSRIANLIKNDSAFLKELDKVILNSNGNTIDGSISVMFEEGDLYYSIHRSKISLNGYKMNNGKWNITGTLYDEYDYTEIMTYMAGNKATLGTIANDAAVLSQIVGAINPYHIYVNFNVMR